MSAQPGWYHAANDAPGSLRWWDGSTWTEHTHLPPPSASDTISVYRPPGHYEPVVPSTASDPRPLTSTPALPGYPLRPPTSDPAPVDPASALSEHLARPPLSSPPAKRRTGWVIGLVAGSVVLFGLVAAVALGLSGVIGSSSGEESAVDLDVVSSPVETDTGAAPTAAETLDPNRDPSADAPTSVPPIPDDLSYEDAIDVSLADARAFWMVRQPEVFGTEHEPVANIVPYRPSDPSTFPTCGRELPTELISGNAFYCPLNDTIAWDDESLLPGLYDEFGDLAVSMVLVHEYGHAIQARVDTEDQPTIVIELQADCFTGAWAGAVDRGESRTGLQLAEGDLDEALAGYLTVRDPPGTDPLDPSAHGNGFDRLSAFLRGFRDDVESCAEIDNSPPESSKLPATLGDLETGGDLPLDQLLPLLEPDLDAVYAQLAREQGLTYRSPARESFDSRLEAGSRCASASPGASPDLEAMACTDEHRLVWDLALADQLFETHGDMGATYPLIHAWAQLLVVENNLAEDEQIVELADCWAGAFLGVLFPPRTQPDPDDVTIESSIRLSPGDLDEAIGTLLVYSPLLPDGLARYSGQAFDRLSHLEDGVSVGASACLG